MFAQAAPELPPEGGYALYPNYAAVDCEAGEFNGAPYTGQIKSVEAVDDITVVFNLCNPDGSFLPKIAFSAFAINDADYLIEHGPDGSIVENPNGTGPYMLDEWRRGQEIIFKANPNYWGDAPLSETAVLRWSSEPGQKLIELSSGNVDGVDNPGPDDLEGIEADANLVLNPRDGQNVLYMGMNNTYEPFSNEKIRQAIAHGIDKQRLVDSFYPAGSSVADYFTPCSYDFACEGEPFWPFDPEAGKALLAEGMAELGIDAFPEIQIHIRDIDRPYIPLTSQVAVDIQDQLANNLGITATIDTRESTAFIDASDNGELPGIHLLGWNADYPDPTNFLDYHFGPGATAQFGEGWPDIWEALARGAQSADPEVRTAGLCRCQQRSSSSTCRWCPSHAAGRPPPGRPMSKGPTRPRCRTSSSRSSALAPTISSCSCRTASRAVCTAWTRATESRSARASRSTNRCTASSSRMPPRSRPWLRRVNRTRPRPSSPARSVRASPSTMARPSTPRTW